MIIHCISRLNLLFFIGLSLPLFLGCQTAPFSNQDNYEEQIAAESAGDKQFSGLYHNFEFRSTIMSHNMITTINNRMAQIYDWSPEKKSEDLNERLALAKKNTRFFVSFFTPSIANDNLTSVKSIWKTYIVSEGTRYEGRVLKANKNLSEAQALYPYHNRWATAYLFEFPVPTENIEGSSVELIVTGPLGRRVVQFQPKAAKTTLQ